MWDCSGQVGFLSGCALSRLRLANGRYSKRLTVVTTTGQWQNGFAAIWCDFGFQLFDLDLQLDSFFACRGFHPGPSPKFSV
jgi:hypothetical protein